MKVKGILFSEEQDKQGEKVLIKGAKFKNSELPIESTTGNLLGRLTFFAPVYRATVDDSVELAMKANLFESAPQNQDENALTGTNYLQLKYPFIKIKANLMDHVALKEAILAGNLYFGFEGKVLKRIDNVVLECHIEKIWLTLSPSQLCSKIYLEE